MNQTIPPFTPEQVAFVHRLVVGPPGAIVTALEAAGVDLLADADQSHLVCRAMRAVYDPIAGPAVRERLYAANLAKPEWFAGAGS